MAKKRTKTKAAEVEPEPQLPEVKPNPALEMALEGTGFANLHDAFKSAMEKLKENKTENNDEVDDVD